MRVTSFLLLSAVALVAQVSSLPVSTLHHRNLVHRRSSSDHGNVARHDSLEAQEHELEAALTHYEQYGDAESLERYLKGFTGDNSAQSDDKKNSDDGSKDGNNAPQSEGKNASKAAGGSYDGNKTSQSDNKDASKSTGDSKANDHNSAPGKNAAQSNGNAAQAGSDSSKHDDQQQHHDDQQQDEEDCDDTSDGQDNSQQSQSQPKKMVKQPKSKSPSQPASGDYSAPAPAPGPSKPQPAPQQPDTSKPNDSDNCIDGYTPPSFSTTSSPSVSSLYTSPSFTGKATFYNTGLGACGVTNSDNHPIVAVSKDIFEQYNPSSGNPSHNSLCGRKVEITWQGKKEMAFAMDECPSCDKSSLDLSPSVFARLDSKDKGVLDGISWRFV